MGYYTRLYWNKKFFLEIWKVTASIFLTWPVLAHEEASKSHLFLYGPFGPWTRVPSHSLAAAIGGDMGRTAGPLVFIFFVFLYFIFLFYFPVLNLIFISLIFFLFITSNVLANFFLFPGTLCTLFFLYCWDFSGKVITYLFFKVGYFFYATKNIIVMLEFFPHDVKTFFY